MLLPLQEVAVATHPLSGTAAQWLWAVPLLPLLGFLINGALSLVDSFHKGPSDPTAQHGDDHGAHEEYLGHEHDHDGDRDASHIPARHKFAGITSIVGPGVLLLSFILSATIFVAMRGAGELHAPFIQRYFSWMPVGDLKIDASFQLDQLSMMMTLVVTGVGTLIHIFSVGYMQEDPGTRATSRTSISSSSSCCCSSWAATTRCCSWVGKASVSARIS